MSGLRVSVILTRALLFFTVKMTCLIFNYAESCLSWARGDIYFIGTNWIYANKLHKIFLIIKGANRTISCSWFLHIQSAEVKESFSSFLKQQIFICSDRLCQGKVISQWQWCIQNFKSWAHRAHGSWKKRKTLYVGTSGGG